MTGPIYEGDGGRFLTASRQTGGNIVPGTHRPLYAANVQKAAAAKRVMDNTIFMVRGDTPPRARGGQGNLEVVLGYKFTDEAIVVYRGASWDKLHTSVDVPALVADLDKSGTLSQQETDVLSKWMREAERKRKPLNLPLLLRTSGLLGHTTVGLTQAQKAGKPAMALVKLIIRKTSVKVLQKQNVDTSKFLSGGELAQSSVDGLLEDLQEYSFEDLF